MGVLATMGVGRISQLFDKLIRIDLLKLSLKYYLNTQVGAYVAMENHFGVAVLVLCEISKLGC